MGRKKTWFNGLSTEILSFPSPRLQQPDEEGDGEEREGKYSEEIAERPIKQLKGGVGDKKQACDFSNSDNRSFFWGNSNQMVSGQQHKQYSRNSCYHIDEVAKRPIHQLENKAEKT